jgi:hypothetical protein
MLLCSARNDPRGRSRRELQIHRPRERLASAEYGQSFVPCATPDRSRRVEAFCVDSGITVVVIFGPGTAKVTASRPNFSGRAWMSKRRRSGCSLGMAPVCASYLSAFAAAISKTVTNGTPEQNRTTSMANFVIATPPIPYNPSLGQSLNWTEAWPTAVSNGDSI